MVKAIRAAERLIADNPLIAPVELQLEDFPQGFRSIVAGKLHKIVYFVDGDELRVSAVWDCRRNPDTLLKIAKQDKWN